mmetsp:Transcript_78267/g.254118  ORF Transcript_78267/g.254118 Transcript_78267/m.254118 type:complete len:289 (-) Transcript_78267:2655-3521(-)
MPFEPGGTMRALQPPVRSETSSSAHISTWFASSSALRDRSSRTCASKCWIVASACLSATESPVGCCQLAGTLLRAPGPTAAATEEDAFAPPPLRPPPPPCDGEVGLAAPVLEAPTLPPRPRSATPLIRARGDGRRPTEATAADAAVSGRGRKPSPPRPGPGPAAAEVGEERADGGARPGGATSGPVDEDDSGLPAAVEAVADKAASQPPAASAGATACTASCASAAAVADHGGEAARPIDRAGEAATGSQATEAPLEQGGGTTQHRRCVTVSEAGNPASSGEDAVVPT